MLDLLLISGIVKPNSVVSENYLYPFIYSVPIASIYESLKEKNAIRIFIPEVVGKNYLEVLPEARVYAFSVSYLEMLEAKNMVLYIKSKYPSSKIVFGGQYPTAFDRDMFNFVNIDYVVRGNGVVAIDNILNGKMCANISTPESSCEILLDRSEIISSSVLDKDAYIGIDWDLVENNPMCYKKERWIVTSHGCLFNCSFCTNKKHSDQKIIYRNVDNIIKEIDSYAKQNDGLLISLTEPEFNTKNKAYREYIHNLLYRIYHETSFDKRNTLSVFCKSSDIDDEFIEILDKFKDKINYEFVIGVENFNNEILADMNKYDTKEKIFSTFNKLKDISFLKKISGSIILGTPNYSDAVFQENIEETYNLYKLYKNSHIVLELSASPLFLIPGSRYYDEKYKHKDIYIQEDDIEKQIQFVEFNGSRIINAGLQPDWFIKTQTHRQKYDEEREKIRCNSQ